MEQNTHPRISPEWVGTATHLAPGRAEAQLAATAPMAADERGLVHGGFTFGLADYTAMLAVNDPFVVLGAAQTRFLKPVTVGQVMKATATVQSERGKKRTVLVAVHVDGELVFDGEFTCFVLEQHVLES